MTTKDNHSGFLGTYFDKETILKVARASKVLAWVVLGVYTLHLLLIIGSDILQVRNGYWVGMPIIDQIQNILYSLEQPLHGVVYFFALMGISQLLLIFMDVEDNTRRAARQQE